MTPRALLATTLAALLTAPPAAWATPHAADDGIERTTDDLLDNPAEDDAPVDRAAVAPPTYALGSQTEARGRAVAGTRRVGVPPPSTARPHVPGKGPGVKTLLVLGAALGTAWIVLLVMLRGT